MAASGEKVFDAEKFRKQIKHFDNPNAGESGNAIRLALKISADAGKHFYEAVELAYGGADSERVKELEAEAETLAAKVLEFQDANSELQNEIDRLIAERENAGEDETPKPAPTHTNWAAMFRGWLPSLAWSWPNALTLALGFLIALSWIWAIFSEYGSP